MPDMTFVYVVPGPNNADNIFLNGNMLRLLDIFHPIEQEFAYTTSWDDPNTLIFAESLKLMRSFLDETKAVGRRCVVVTQEVYHETTLDTFELYSLNAIRIYNCLNGKFYLTPFYSFYGIPEGSFCMEEKTEANYSTKLCYFGNIWRENWNAPCSLYLRRTKLAVLGLKSGLVDELYSRDFVAASVSGKESELERDIAALSSRVIKSVSRAEKLVITRALFFSLECLPTMSHNFVSERPFDAILSGCVPVFMGTSSLKAVFPADSIIYMDDFPSDEDCLHYVKSLSFGDWRLRMDKCEGIVRKLAPAGNTGDHLICTLLKSILDDAAPHPPAVNIFKMEEPMFLSRIGGTDYTVANLHYGWHLPDEEGLCAAREYSGYFDKDANPANTADYLAQITESIRHSKVVMETLPARRTDGRYPTETLFEQSVLKNHLITSYSYVEGVFPFLHDFKAYCEGVHRRVLVVSPFSATIRHQCHFKDDLVRTFSYPAFELLTFDVPVTYNDGSSADVLSNVPFRNWSEAAASMCEAIGKLDFDFAMISAGSYSYPLGDYISRTMGKKCVYVGGIMNVLFAIRSGRYHAKGSGYENINPPHRLITAFEMPKVEQVKCSRLRSSEAVVGYFARTPQDQPLRACVVYAGAYNVFDTAFPGHQKNIFDVCASMGFEVDVFADVAELIELRSNSYGSDAEEAAGFVQHSYLTEPSIAQHIPSNWREHLADKKIAYSRRRVSASDTNNPFIVVGSQQLDSEGGGDYCKTSFEQKFGKALVSYTGKNVEAIYGLPADDNPHEIHSFFETTLYKRNQAMSRVVRRHEAAIGKAYDIVISLRPDVFVDVELGRVLRAVMDEPTRRFCGRQSLDTHLFNNAENKLFRLDFIFVAKCFFSELIGHADVALLEDAKGSGEYNTFETSIGQILTLSPVE